MLDDSVFIGTMTTSGGSVTVTSGSNAPVTSSFAAGVQVFSVPMGVGTQSFQFSTTAGKSGTATSNVTISADCWVSRHYRSERIVTDVRRTESTTSIIIRVQSSLDGRGSFESGSWYRSVISANEDLSALVS